MLRLFLVLRFLRIRPPWLEGHNDLAALAAIAALAFIASCEIASCEFVRRALFGSGDDGGDV